MILGTIPPLPPLSAFSTAALSLAFVLLLSAPPSFASASSPSTSHCRYACGPHGTCRPSDGTSSAVPNSYTCVCDADWSGPDCSVPYVTCDDGKRRCYNNSECRRNKNPNEDGTYGYKCDCSLSFGISAFAGHECENSATQICEISTPLSRHAFCTNGGQCRAFVLPGEEHAGCDCPDEFEGMHCQYLRGTAPAEELERADPRAYDESHEKGRGHIGAGGIAAIIILILGVFAGIVYGYILYLQRQEGVQKNYIEGLDDDHRDGGGEKKAEEYNLKGRNEEVELAAAGGSAKKGRKGHIAASMALDPDGSSTMPPNGRTSAGAADSNEDKFDDDEAQLPAAGGGGMGGDLI